MAIAGMKMGGSSISFWISILPIVIGLPFGIWAYKWMDDLATDGYLEEITLDSISDSVFDNGISATWNSFVDGVMGNAMWAIGRGIAVYSNLSFLTGMIIFWIYR